MMGTAARVVVLPKEDGPLRIEDVTLPDPGPTQVLVKQFASGICHSQLHEMHRPNRPNPVVLGHESTGVVLKAGAQIRHVKEGDTVMVTWIARDPGKASNPPLPATVEVSDGTAMAQGVYTWADHTLVDQQYVVKVDPNIKKDVTAIIGCAVMTGAGAIVSKAKVRPGQSVAIFGIGGVGLSAVAAAKVAGANPIIVVDLDDEKLEFGKKFGATHCINARKEDPIRAIRKLTTPEGLSRMETRYLSGVDYSFDCIGVRQTMEQIIPVLRRGRIGVVSGGTGILVGIPQTPMEVMPMDIIGGEKYLTGTLAGNSVPERDFPMFLKWYEEGNLDLDALVTARYKIDQINEATTALENGMIKGRAILEFDLK